MVRKNWHAYAGGFGGGLTGIICSYPLDSMKTRLQSKIPIKFSIPALYRGVSYPLWGIAIEKVFVFGMYDTIKNKKYFENKNMNILVSGLSTGLLSTTIVTPIERVKILKQNNRNVSELMNKGMKNLYHGWSATLLREFPGYGVYFYTYDTLRPKLKESYFNSYLCGSLSGISAWICIYPPDSIKTVMQDRGLSMKESTKHIYNMGGIKGFYRGYTFGLLRAAVLHGGVFAGNDFILKMLQ